MSLVMPELDRDVLARRAEIVAALRHIVPGEGVIDSAIEMKPFESGQAHRLQDLPLAVVLPETVEQVSQVLRYCHDNRSEWCRAARHVALRRLTPLGDAVLLGM